MANAWIAGTQVITVLVVPLFTWQMTFGWPVGYYRLAPAAGHSGVYGAGLSSPECDACRATEHVAPCGWLRRSPVVESP